MKINVKDIVNGVKALPAKICFKVKKHSPEILVITGVAAIVTGTVMACKATTKIDSCFDELDDMNDKLEQLEDENVAEAVAEKFREKYGEEFTEEDIERDKIVVYAHTAAKLLKLYAPSVFLICLGIASMLGSNYILRSRWLGMSAAYAALDTSVKEYRKRVAGEVGEDAEKKLFNNIGTVDVAEDKGNGMSEIVKKDVLPKKGLLGSPYAVLFDEHNRNWTRDPQYNRVLLRCALNRANDLLRIRGYLYLYEVYNLLEFRYEPRNNRYDISEEQARASRYVGWTTDGDGDGYVDFGTKFTIFDEDCDDEPSVILDFNVDGDILNTMYKKK